MSRDRDDTYKDGRMSKYKGEEYDGMRIGEVSTFERLYPHEQLVVCGDLVFALDFVVEVDACEATVGVDLDLLTLHKFAAESLLAVLLKVKYDFVPAIVKLERHGALKGLDARDGLVVTTDEGAFDVFVVQYGHLEPEVFVKLHCIAGTFLTRRTRMGILIRMEVDFPGGNER